MAFTISYATDRGIVSPLSLPAPAAAVRALLPVAALKGIRELGDPSGNNSSGLAQQVFARRKPQELAARSRSGDLQATSVAVRGGSDHVLTLHQTAKAASATSAGFDNGSTVRAGSLTLSVDGRDHAVTVAKGDSLLRVAESVNATAADVQANVIVENGKQRLSIVRKTVGYDSALGASSALSVSEAYGGGEGRTLDLQLTQAAHNARLTVDGRTIERRTNSISDAVVGTTVHLDASDESTQVFAGRDGAASSRSPAANVSAFTISVKQIAAAAEARSAEFTSPYEQVQSGKILIRVDGGQYLIPIAEGANLLQAASAINASGASVNTRLERKEGHVTLAVTAKNTGHAAGSEPSAAFSIGFESTGSTGKALDISVSRPAQNAKVVLNGVAIESQSNELAGAAGITSISLQTVSDGEETQGALLSSHVSSAAQALDQVNANAHVARLLQDQVVDLAVAPKDAAIAAPQAKKLYGPETQSDDVVAKPTRSEHEVFPARRGFPAELSPAPPPWAADKAKGRDAKPTNASASGLARTAEPKNPYAPKAEEDDGNPLKQANDSLAQRRLALSNKAKRAYAQFTA